MALILNTILLKFYCNKKNIKSFEEYKNHNNDIDIYFKYKNKIPLLIYIDTNASINESKSISKNILFKEIDKIYREIKILPIVNKDNYSMLNKTIIENYDYLYSSLIKYLDDNKHYFQLQIEDNIDVIMTLPLPDLYKNMSILLLDDIMYTTGLIIYKKDDFFYIQMNKFNDPFI